MAIRVSQFALVVREYDEAIAFYVNVLGFRLLEDTDRGHGKRWVRLGPGNPVGACDPASSTGRGGLHMEPDAQSPAILLARATTPAQAATIGNQTGGRVFLFVETDDFERDYARLKAHGVKFRESPRQEAYGTVVVLEDLYGNLIDLIQPNR